MTSNSDYTESAALSGADLLPKDSNSEWNNLNLEKNANGVVMPDMLQAGVHQGLDTVGSVLRNANQQLRPDPPIPKSNAGLCNVNLSTIHEASKLKYKKIFAFTTRKVRFCHLYAFFIES